MTSLRVLILSGLLLAGCGPASTPPDALQLGQPFPALTLTDLEGQQKALSDYRGKTVILNVWATWCAPCRKELPSLQRLSEQLDPAHYVVIGLSLDDDVHVVREYLLDKKVSFPNYLDPGAQLAREVLGINVYPDTFIIAPDGTLLRRYVAERQWDSAAMRREIEG